MEGKFSLNGGLPLQYRPLNYDSGKEDAQKAQIQSYTVVLKVERDVTVVRINRHFLKSPDEGQ